MEEIKDHYYLNSNGKGALNVWGIDAHMGLHKIEQEGYYGYHGVVCSGDFSSEGLPDYGRGILELHIRISDCEICHQGVAISTIDDGVWQSSGDVDKAKIDAIAKKFTEEYGQVLPSEKEFNEFLRPFGLWGVNTG